MYAIDRIATYTGYVADFFYEVYLEVLGWVWPFYKAADFFYELCYWTNKVKWRFEDFSEDMDDIVNQLGDILSWSNIRSLIRSWLPDIDDLIDWWDRWWVWVGEEIDEWWYSTRTTVQGWIDIGDQWLKGLIDDAEAWLVDLQAAWDNFRTITLPDLLDLSGLITWWNTTVSDVQALIDSAFTARESFWSGWLDVKDSVIEFFNDPLEWLWQRFLDWFLGKEE